MRARLALLWFTSLLLSTQVNASTWKLRPLPLFQEQQLFSDAPRDWALSQDEKTLAAVGKTALWLWDTTQQQLRKISLPNSLASGGWYRVRSAANGDWILMSDAQLLQIATDPLMVSVYALPMPQTQPAVDVQCFGPTCWWFHRQALMKIDTEHRTLTQTRPATDLKDQDRVCFDATTRQALVLRQQNLWLGDVTEDGLKLRFLHQSQQPILACHALAEGKGFLILTSQVAIQMDTHGKLAKTIPVAAPERVLDVNINANRHVFVFESGLVETFDLLTQQNSRTRLPYSFTANDHMIAVGERAIAALNQQRKLLLWRLD